VNRLYNIILAVNSLEGMKRPIITLTLLLIVTCCSIYAQEVDYSKLPVADYYNPKEYEIGGITVSGVKYLDENILVQLSGLTVGERVMIPGEKITQAVEKLWKHGLFSDVKIILTRTEGDLAFLNIYLGERPRLSKIDFTGIRKNERQDLLEKINLLKGSQVTENVLNNTKKILTDYYVGKGFLHTDVTITQEDDPKLSNNVNLTIDVEKNDRMKIKEIRFEGNSVLSDGQLRRSMKKTKRRDLNVFKVSKYIEKEYKADKDKITKKYNEAGYRDFRFLKDSLYVLDEDRVGLTLWVEEGPRYYHRNITWVGNTKYPSELLSTVLGIKKGDPYNQTLLEERLLTDEDAVSSVYMDNGYLFSSITPVESVIDKDSIDLEMVVFEGKQATINKVIINGNTKTNEHVVRRELRTKPGDLFSKTDIMRSVRELAVLGHFDPEKIVPNPIPNQAEGTVDLEYNLEERANDQFEISGGWGANMLIGTIGLRFSNFSMRNIFHADAWRPIPSGDGQNLSIRAQSNGKYYQAYSLTFVEPWFGGKKPNSLSVSFYRTIQSNGRKKNEAGRQSIYINGISVGSLRRLTWPDDFFTLYNEVSFQDYRLDNWSAYFLFSDGNSNNFSFTTALGRNSVDQMIYPRRGSSVTLSLQVTPPYSLFTNKDYSLLPDSEKYKWIEFHKWLFKFDSYTKLAGDLVLSTRAHFGYLGYYNNGIGPSPFEGFDLGGDGMSGYSLYGRETIGLRGYENGSLTPIVDGKKAGNVYSKLSLELRYPISLNPQATLYGLVFLEGGNAWYKIGDFNPFRIKRSAGIGIRAYLPMFGMLGIDWGYGFDEIPGLPSANKGQFHFVIGQQF
jgi:outer membrane protein insertion porin family